jgi:DNA adenine methylase
MLTREEVKAIMKAILKYPGAKNRIAKWIVEHIPTHKVYCEPFFGSGAVFFNKKTCYNEILNDIDDEIYNFFVTLRKHPDELV